MAKRKKSKQPTKSKTVAAPGTEQSATAPEAVADVAQGTPEIESVSESAAENDQANDAGVEPTEPAAAEPAPSEMVSDATATEQLADASGEEDMPELTGNASQAEPATDASASSEEAPPARATGKKGKQRSKNKQGGGKQRTAPKQPSAEEPTAPDVDVAAEPFADADVAAQGQPGPSELESNQASQAQLDSQGPQASLDAEAEGDSPDGTAQPPAEASDASAISAEADGRQPEPDQPEPGPSGDDDERAKGDSPPEATSDGDQAAEASAPSAEGDAATDQPPAGDAGNQAPGEGAPTAAEESTEDQGQVLEGDRLESIIESLLFASDKALSLSDLRRLLGERDGKKITAAVQSLIQKRMDTGIQVVTLSTGWHLRTAVDNAAWVSKLLVGKPVRLSRAMMETLAIVAYRQPVTRPEVDDIRGVDCGAVLKTLLERGLVRIIGKKEEVGRPMLYGTTPEFLRVFNLRDLTELPTLREFYDLSAEDQNKVDAEAPPPSATTAKPEVALNSVSRGALAPESEDADPLLDELDAASNLAKKALGELEPKEEPASDAEKSQEPDAAASAKTKNEPESTPAGE